MKISKNVFAFLAAAAMVGCSSSDEVVNPTSPSVPGESGDGMIEITMQSSMEKSETPSTKVNAGLTNTGGLSYTWENGDQVDFVPFGGKVTKLTAVSVDETFSSATFNGGVYAGMTNRIVIAPKDAITYGAGNATATLSVASQSCTLADSFMAGFDENVPDNLFFINNDGVRKGVNYATDILNVTFAHINTNVIFRLKFAQGAFDGVSDYKITKFTLENVTSEADVNLKVGHKADNFMTPKATGSIVVDVDSKICVEEYTSALNEYWIPVSVFPGITKSNDAKVTVWLETPAVNGKKKIGFATFGLNNLMGNNTYDAGTNSAISLNVGEVQTLIVKDDEKNIIEDGERVIIEVGEEFPFTVEPSEGYSVSSTMSNNDIDCYGTAGSYTIIGMYPSKDDETRVEIKDADGVIIYTFFVTVIPKTSIEITGTDLIKVSSDDMDGFVPQIIDDLALKITQNSQSEKEYTWEWSVEDSSSVTNTKITADADDDTNATVTFMAYPDMKSKTLTVTVTAKEDPNITATHVIDVLTPIGFDVTDPDKPGQGGGGNVEVEGPGDPNEQPETVLKPKK